MDNRASLPDFAGRISRVGFRGLDFAGRICLLIGLLASTLPPPCQRAWPHWSSAIFLSLRRGSAQTLRPKCLLAMAPDRLSGKTRSPLALCPHHRALRQRGFAQALSPSPATTWQSNRSAWSQNRLRCTPSVAALTARRQQYAAALPCARKPHRSAPSVPTNPADHIMSGVWGGLRGICGRFAKGFVWLLPIFSPGRSPKAPPAPKIQSRTQCWRAHHEACLLEEGGRRERPRTTESC